MYSIRTNIPASWDLHDQEPLLSFRESCLACQVEEILAKPSFTYHLSLLMPMVEICLFSKNLYIYISVALAYFDFRAGDFILEWAKVSCLFLFVLRFCTVVADAG
jgi:hypothetical protein